MNKPAVSILIPTYNSEKYIAETIKSALSQTYKNFEIIIVDNASMDKTYEIIQDFANKYNCIKAFRNETNIGPVRNWIRCISRAKGKYGKILWSDDLMQSTFLEKSVDILETNVDVGFVFTPAIIFGDKFREKLFYTISNKSGIFSTKQFIEGILYDKDYPNSPACALFRLEDLKKNLLLKIPNNFNSDASVHAIGNDLLIFLLTAKDYDKFAYINEPLSMLRAHGDSITISTKKTKLVLNYDIAKAYFVENYYYDINTIQRFNAILWLHSKIFKTSNSIEEFYLKNKIYKKDYIFLLKNLFTYDAYIKRAIRRFFR